MTTTVQQELELQILEANKSIHWIFLLFKPSTSWRFVAEKSTEIQTLLWAMTNDKGFGFTA